MKKHLLKFIACNESENMELDFPDYLSAQRFINLQEFPREWKVKQLA